MDLLGIFFEDLQTWIFKDLYRGPADVESFSGTCTRVFLWYLEVECFYIFKRIQKWLFKHFPHFLFFFNLKCVFLVFLKVKYFLGPQAFFQIFENLVSRTFIHGFFLKIFSDIQTFLQTWRTFTAIGIAFNFLQWSVPLVWILLKKFLRGLGGQGFPLITLFKNNFKDL